jgi:hypothetical protein
MRIILLTACLSFCLGAHAADSSLANFICDPVTDAGERTQCIERASVATRHETSKISEGLPLAVHDLADWVVGCLLRVRLAHRPLYLSGRETARMDLSRNPSRVVGSSSLIRAALWTSCLLGPPLFQVCTELPGGHCATVSASVQRMTPSDSNKTMEPTR